MSFFSRLFGRSQTSEEEAEAEGTAEEKAAPSNGKTEAGAQLRRRKESVKRAPPPVEQRSGIASAGPAPQQARPSAGLFKKRTPAPSSGAKPASPAQSAAQPAAKTAPQPAAAPAARRPKPTPQAALAPQAVEPAPAGPAKGGAVLEDLLGNLDESFDAIIAEQPDGPATAGGEPNTDDFDRLTVLELFFDIATNHLRPVRNFMIELHLGDVRREWVQIAQPAIKSIQSAAEQIDIPDLKAALGDFDAMLSIASESRGDMISGELREEFINQYKRLAEIMPQAFTLEEEKDQRESLIVHSLLMQVPDVRKVTIDKLYRAGLTALEVLFLATTEDLEATTGVRKILAQRIVDKFQGFRSQLQESIPDAENSAQIQQLTEHVKLLEEQQALYDNAASKRDLREKRAHRLARQGTFLEITVVLAQLGEVELVESLERMAFEKRIERLKQYLMELKEKS